jgi:membrane protein DedA with SNARE-associated domain/rhodanese-related sulfurtransferase
MTETTQFLMRHGLPLVFGAVLIEQLGVPIPAVPLLLAVGALSATGNFSLVMGIFVTVIACLIADASWFYLGRYRGNQVLGFLCRIALEPDSCVRRAQNVFTRYGLRGIVVAKFVPGMSTVAPPLAGMAGIHAVRFLAVDAVGALLYGSIFLGLGYAFSRQIDQIGAAITHIGGSALSLVVVVAAAWIGYKFWQRQRLLRELRTARITVTELRQKVEAGEQPVILDLRSPAELEQNPAVIAGAIHLLLEDVESRRHEFPHDRDIVVYCSCPNEVTAAKVALLLQRKGFTRVRPLLGGIAAWRAENYPMGTRVLDANRKKPATDPATAANTQSAGVTVTLGQAVISANALASEVSRKPNETMDQS